MVCGEHPGKVQSNEGEVPCARLGTLSCFWLHQIERVYIRAGEEHPVKVQLQEGEVTMSNVRCPLLLLVTSNRKRAQHGLWIASYEEAIM